MLLSAIKTRLYSLFNAILLGLPEDYYRYKFFSRETYISPILDIYSSAVKKHIQNKSIFTKFCKRGDTKWL